jgi:hypothetical protein
MKMLGGNEDGRKCRFPITKARRWRYGSRSVVASSSGVAKRKILRARNKALRMTKT